MLLDIEQADLDACPTTRQEYDALAEILRRLRLQGAQVLVLDVLLRRGEEADFRAFWEQLRESKDLIVLGDSFEGSTRVPPDLEVTRGMLNLESDPDGVLRSYRLAHRRDLVSAPSLALAAYLKMRGSAWQPEMLRPREQVALPFLTEEGTPAERLVPLQVMLDQREVWDRPSPRNFNHLRASALKEGKLPLLAGKAVFIGYVSPGSTDVGATPLAKGQPKVGIHAMALNGLLQQDWFVPLGSAPAGLVGMALLVLSFRVSRLPRRRLWLAWPLSSVAVAGGGLALLLVWHRVPWLVSWLVLWNLSLGLDVWTRGTIRRSRLEALQVLTDAEDPLARKVVGPYQLVRKLGAGGFAAVYQAVPRDTLDPDQSVAVKVVHPNWAEDADFRRRFLREVRISSDLSHPNIVRVFSSGEDKGLLYMAMELLPGRPLSHYLEDGPPLSEEETLQILRPILSALAHAHGRNVLHRDLKPDNLIVRLAGETHPWKVARVTILDFGLAFDREASQLTRTGEVFGTLDYLAPERIQGCADDPRSDLYAVGVMAYEMLAGLNPFRRENTAEALLFRLTQDPARISELRSDLSEALARTVTSLLDRDPSGRPPTAQAVLEALDRI